MPAPRGALRRGRVENLPQAESRRDVRGCLNTGATYNCKSGKTACVHGRKLAASLPTWRLAGRGDARRLTRL